MIVICKKNGLSFPKCMDFKIMFLWKVKINTQQNEKNSYSFIPSNFNFM